MSFAYNNSGKEGFTHRAKLQKSLKFLMIGYFYTWFYYIVMSTFAYQLEAF